MSSLFKSSLLLTFFFGIDKIVALFRQAIIVKQFGFSAQMDAFNAANNIPDLLSALIAGGALSLAFIPVLTESLEKHGRKESWKLFSIVANLVFLTTAFLSILVAIFADHLITSQFGIAPGFTANQQALTINLMRLNLIATLIFSVSGLVMGALQANKHFLFPALAPILYNFGQIFGALYLTHFFGIYGLAYGVLLGALLHLLIQIPGMIHYGVTWTPSLNIHYHGVHKTFLLMGPRICTVFLIQLMFITRDNLASRLHEGSVTALTYGYFIMQVPETLIGTAIATALLPTLSELIAKDNKSEFSKLFSKTVEIIFALTISVSILLALSLDYFIKPLFGFDDKSASLLIWTSRAFLLGLLSQCLLEIVTRAFYAVQNARIPLIITSLRTAIFIFLSVLLVQPLGVVGLALTDSIAVSFEAFVLFFLLRKTLADFFTVHGTLIRTFLGSLLSVSLIYLLIHFSPFPIFPSALGAFLLGGVVCLFFIKRELSLLFRL